MGREKVVMTPDRLELLLRWLQCYSEQDLADAIRGATADPWVMGRTARSERRNDELKQILRESDVIERHACAGRAMRKAEAFRPAAETERRRSDDEARAWWEQHGGEDLVRRGLEAWWRENKGPAIGRDSTPVVEQWLTERGESAPAKVIAALQGTVGAWQRLAEEPGEAAAAVEAAEAAVRSTAEADVEAWHALARAYTLACRHEDALRARARGGEVAAAAARAAAERRREDEAREREAEAVRQEEVNRLGVERCRQALEAALRGQGSGVRA